MLLALAAAKSCSVTIGVLKSKASLPIWTRIYISVSMEELMSSPNDTVGLRDPSKGEVRTPIEKLKRHALSVPPSPSSERKLIGRSNQSTELGSPNSQGNSHPAIITCLDSPILSRHSGKNTDDDDIEAITDQESVVRKKKRKRKLHFFQKKVEKFVKSDWSGLPLGILYGLIFLLITSLILESEDNPETKLSTENITNEVEKSPLSSVFEKNRSVAKADKSTANSFDSPLFSVSKRTESIVSVVCGAAVALMVVLGSLLSLKLKTTFLLMIPALIAGRGRSFIMSLGFGIMIKGPAGNIEANVQEGVRSLICMYEEMEELAVNYTDQLTTIDDDIDKIIKEFESTLEEMQNEAKEKNKEIIKRVNSSLRDLRKIKEAGQKLGRACDGAVSFFSFGLADCSLPDWNIVDRVKDEIEGTLNNTFNNMKENMDFLDVDRSSLVGELEGHSISEIKERLKNVLRGAFALFQKSVIILEKLIYLNVFLAIRDARLYIKRFFLKDSFDNRLVDTNVKKLWRRESVKMGRTLEKLTPLRNWEKKEGYQSTFEKHLSPLEKKKMLLKSLPVLVFSLFVMAVVLMDVLLVKSLQMVNDNAEFGITYDGMEVGMNLSVAVRDFETSSSPTMNIRGFNLTTAECLPKASTVNSSYHFQLATIIVLLFTSSLLNAYTTRLNSKICNLFFIGRAEERAKYLYNKIVDGKYINRQIS